MNRCGVIMDRRGVDVDLCRSFRVLITTIGVYQWIEIIKIVLLNTVRVIFEIFNHICRYIIE